MKDIVIVRIGEFCPPENEHEVKARVEQALCDAGRDAVVLMLPYAVTLSVLEGQSSVNSYPILTEETMTIPKLKWTYRYSDE